jgi:membrane protease YdiL (CAAX protease family)
VAIGTAGIGVTAALMAVAGDVHVAGFGLDLGVLVRAFVVLGVSAVVEELVFRALIIGGLLRLTGSAALALVVSSAAFGLLLLVTTADATTLSVLSTTVGGVMYGLAYLRTGSIWMGVGIHFAWNFVQATVLGFVMSGTDDYSGALWHLSGGGDYGPEGTAWSLVGRSVVIALVLAVSARCAKVEAWTSGSAS